MPQNVPTMATLNTRCCSSVYGSIFRISEYLQRSWLLPEDMCIYVQQLTTNSTLELPWVTYRKNRCVKRNRVVLLINFWFLVLGRVYIIAMGGLNWRKFFTLALPHACIKFSMYLLKQSLVSFRRSWLRLFAQYVPPPSKGTLEKKRRQDVVRGFKNKFTEAACKQMNDDGVDETNNLQNISFKMLSSRTEASWKFHTHEAYSVPSFGGGRRLRAETAWYYT